MVRPRLYGLLVLTMCVLLVVVNWIVLGFIWAAAFAIGLKGAFMLGYFYPQEIEHK